MHKRGPPFRKEPRNPDQSFQGRFRRTPQQCAEAILPYPYFVEGGIDFNLEGLSGFYKHP